MEFFSRYSVSCYSVTRYSVTLFSNTRSTSLISTELELLSAVGFSTCLDGYLCSPTAMIWIHDLSNMVCDKCPTARANVLAVVRSNCT